jgi:RNA polymerase sigma-70 factor (ECF subfamily)
METRDKIRTQQIWTDYKEELFAFIRSRVKNKMEAEDILQEVFIKVHLHLKSLKDQQRLIAWLYQVSRNAIQDYYRKQRNFVSIDNMEPRQEETNTKNKEFLTCMLPFINKLPAKYKEALVFSDLKQMKQTQLADKLKISYSGLKSRVQRARQMLHAYFSECCTIVNDKYGNIVSHESRGHCSCDGAASC